MPPMSFTELTKLLRRNAVALPSQPDFAPVRELEPPPPAPEPAPLPPLVKPVAQRVTATLPREDMARYRGLAQQIGWDVPDLLNEELRHWFEDRGWEIFDSTAVSTYMEGVVRRLNRDTIAQQPNEQEREWRRRNPWTYSWVPLRGRRDSRDGISITPYDLPIPERVLRRVADLDADFGERVAFWVTRVEHVRRADPFILVRARETWSPPFIFDVWDEPGFTG